MNHLWQETRAKSKEKGVKSKKNKHDKRLETQYAGRLTGGK
jgi:hypothetical protein